MASEVQSKRNGRSQMVSPRNVVKDRHAAFRRWESAHISGLRFVETSEHNVAYGLHLHDFMEIIWVRFGSCEIISRDCCCTLRAGDVVVIPPNEVHAGGSSSAHFSFTTLQIPRKLLVALFGSNYTRDYPSLQMAPVLLMDGRAAEALYQDLVGSLPNTASIDDQWACLQDVVGQIFRIRHAATLPGMPMIDCHPAVMRVKSFINSEYTESIDFRRLAIEVNLHQRYLISLFRAITGIPPHQYQIALRVELGRSLLDGHQSLSAVASSAGFADQSHFNRHFKRIYGLTPGMFRDRTVPI